MDKKELQNILELHKVWLEGATLSGTRLPYKMWVYFKTKDKQNLAGANLEPINLEGANMKGADLD